MRIKYICINETNFFFFLHIHYHACAKVRLFVSFDIFKTIFQGKAIYDYVSLSAQRYDFINERVTSGNLTKAKQPKVQIIAGDL